MAAIKNDPLYKEIIQRALGLRYGREDAPRFWTRARIEMALVMIVDLHYEALYARREADDLRRQLEEKERE
ncbi:MAG: hypothetical protein AB1814_10780 [Thermodesulfobacteriota bacterium]